MPPLTGSILLNFAQTTTQQVGAQLLLNSQVQALTQAKSDGSLITASDEWADHQIRMAIHQHFPDHGLLTEEFTQVFPDTDWCWVVDPLDGTTNFARGIPFWGISLGLLYQGIPVFGYAYFPTLGETYYGFWPSAGSDLPTGAFCNGNLIRPTTAGAGPNEFFSFCSRSLGLYCPEFPGKPRVLGSGVYNLLAVAKGSMVGSVEIATKVWDIAAAWVIAQASGAHWLALEPNPPFPLQPGQDYGRRSFPTLLLAHPGLVPVFLPLVQP
ncbi:inositol monophosphatase family protein [Candidatus Cyanaurora vandensis]|uniref:inositol monophosphatase family protein n=1 Tax=Candidatus Cyanaurora vandensis TaxID=2714958 RepID=UPI0025806C81|nr:inositol monophosphatase family protein [Candidatus Cyanaurora vandensis]